MLVRPTAGVLLAVILIALGLMVVVLGTATPMPPDRPLTPPRPTPGVSTPATLLILSQADSVSSAANGN